MNKKSLCIGEPLTNFFFSLLTLSFSSKVYKGGGRPCPKLFRMGWLLKSLFKYLIGASPSILMVAAGSIHQKYFQNQHLTRNNVPWAFSFLHPYSIHWVLLDIISLISKIFTVLSPIYVRAPSFSIWPPILGWIGPVGPLCCNSRLNTEPLYRKQMCVSGYI